MDLISLSFILTTLLTVFFFYRADHGSGKTLIILLAWLFVQGIIASTGFYTVTDTIPPRFVLLVGPPLLGILILFNTQRGKAYIDQLDVAALNLLHIVRIPVELVLYFLFLQKMVPELMTFEGRNLDILSGLTAPLIFYFGYLKKELNRNILLAWNFICLGLLFNIVINAVLAAPFPFQQFAFDQPNLAVFRFPFNWLPGCVVPLVLFSHLVSLRALLKQANS